MSQSMNSSIITKRIVCVCVCIHPLFGDNTLEKKKRYVDLLQGVFGHMHRFVKMHFLLLLQFFLNLVIDH